MSSQPEVEEFYVPRSGSWPPKRVQVPAQEPQEVVPAAGISLPPGVVPPGAGPVHIHVHMAQQPQGEAVMRRHWAMSWGGFAWIMFWSFALLGALYGGLRALGIDLPGWL